MLYLDFRFDGNRYREKTGLVDNKTNRKKMERKLASIEKDIAHGVFEYSKYFGAMFAEVSQLPRKPKTVVQQKASPVPAPVVEESAADIRSTPLFEEFVEEWIEDSKIHWRRSHLKNMESMAQKYFIPAFGEMEVGAITRTHLLKFRSSLAKVSGRNGNKTLSANRINKIMDPLRRIFEEAADRYECNTPFIRIKPLKVKKSDVQPFSLDEVNLILEKVRPDYRNYYLIRFFTGMRTGEIDGLKWKYVDFEKRLILIRETIVDGEEDYTKTDSSQRDIQMSEPVFQALKQQERATKPMSMYVFCNLKGRPLEHNNVTKRIWYPLLANLKLERRRPYQSRHTAATLWLAAGETPEWIARQMGHSTTEMLFKVYSRYVPNLTRQDGSAFERLIASNTYANHQTQQLTKNNEVHYG